MHVYTPLRQPPPSASPRGAVDSVVDFCPLTQCAFPLRSISLTEKAHGFESLKYHIFRKQRCQTLNIRQQLNRHFIIQSASLLRG